MQHHFYSLKLYLWLGLEFTNYGKYNLTLKKMKITRTSGLKKKIFVIENIGLAEITIAFFLKLFNKNVGYVSIQNSRFVLKVASKLSITQLTFEDIFYLEGVGSILEPSNLMVQKISKDPEILSFINIVSNYFFKDIKDTNILMTNLLSMSEFSRMHFESLKKCALFYGYNEVHLITTDSQLNLIRNLYDDKIFIYGWFNRLKSLRVRINIILRGVKPQKKLEVKAHKNTILTKYDHKIIFVPHQGFNYGNLFTFDYFLESDPSSPLCKSNIGLLSYSDINSDGFGDHLYIENKIDIGYIYKYFKTKVKFSFYLRGKQFKFLKNYIFTTCIQALRSKELIQNTYPHSKIAFFAYQFNAPDHLLIALRLAGIESWAELGRPMFAVSNWSKINSHTVLSPSDKFLEFLEESEACAAEKVISVGMWKTDMLLSKKSKKLYSNNKYLCVVLPYHTTSEADSLLNLYLSKNSFEHFILDIIECAILYPDVDFMVRGKNSDWLNNNDYSALQNRLNFQENITVSDNYETLNESYNLCSAADFIIGKYTSLIDESLAVNIPSIIHDYTHNTNNISRTYINYLPRRLWAESFNELCLQINFCLDRSGDTFNEWWEPYRLSLYGKLNNGLVVERTRQQIKQRLTN